MQVVTVGMSRVDRLKLECGAGNDPLHGGERGLEGAKPGRSEVGGRCWGQCGRGGGGVGSAER